MALVRQNGIGAINLVNKAKTDPLLEQIRTIKARCFVFVFPCVGREGTGRDGANGEYVHMEATYLTD